MHRFYLPPELCTGPVLTLDPRESHHAADVLRVRKGERVSVLNGAGREFLCSVSDVHRKAVVLRVDETHETATPAFSLTLVQAVPKGKMMEFIIQKATELGVTRIQPLLSERVTTQLDEEGAEQKAEKWRQTTIEAIKQCGQTWLPSVDPPRSLDQCLASAQAELSLIGALQGEPTHPRKRFDSFRSTHGRNPLSASLWIGPEGDFSPREMEKILSSGVLPVTLGPLVLRAETAALYALSIAGYELRAG